MSVCVFLCLWFCAVILTIMKLKSDHIMPSNLSQYFKNKFSQLNLKTLKLLCLCVLWPNKIIICIPSCALKLQNLSFRKVMVNVLVMLMIATTPPQTLKTKMTMLLTKSILKTKKSENFQKK